MLTSPEVDEPQVALELLAHCRRAGGETVLGHKGYAGRDFAHAVSELGATIIRPRRKTRQAAGRIWRRSASGSSRSSGPAKTSSPSSATAPAPSKASENSSCNASSASPLGRPSRALVDYIA